MERAAKCSRRGFASNKEEHRLWRGLLGCQPRPGDTPSLESPFRPAGQPQTPGRRFSPSSYAPCSVSRSREGRGAGLHGRGLPCRGLLGRRWGPAAAHCNPCSQWRWAVWVPVPVLPASISLYGLSSWLCAVGRRQRCLLRTCALQPILPQASVSPPAKRGSCPLPFRAIYMYSGAPAVDEERGDTYMLNVH